MKNFWKDWTQRTGYGAVLFFYGLARLFPPKVQRGVAHFAGNVLYAVPSVRKLLLANISCAMPETNRRDVCRIARQSCFHLCLNFLELIWLHGNPERIEQQYIIDEDTHRKLCEHVRKGERILFVNPHFGSWEASGIMAPYYCGMDLVAIAKPLRNPYLNRLLNQNGRETNRGLRIIFSRGALRESIRALREGSSIGMLIDQNTRVRDGGEWVNFFGIPVTSSKIPATLKRFCDGEKIPSVIVYGSAVRGEDGKIHSHIAYLPKPFGEYPDDRAVLQALMDISETYIRRYPEQYLWFYRRFQNIPQNVPEEIRKRYPYYAEVPTPSFFDIRAKHLKARGQG